MAEKPNPDTINADLRTVIKPDNGNIASKLAGTGNDANLLRMRTRQRIQPSASDLRMVVRIQRKNKHPHSTKKHK